MNDDPLPEDQGSEISDGVFFFRKQKLFPFSFERQAAAQRLGDDSGAENDLLLVYLCLQPSEVIEAARGAGVALFRKRMHEWADANRITINKDNPGRKEISAIANQIWSDLKASDYEPVTKGATKAPDPNVTG